VQSARGGAVSDVRGDEGGDGDGTGVGKELGYFRDAADVFGAVRGGEPEVFVEAEADVVAIKAVGGDTVVKEVLLERCGDGGFARGGQTCEPERQALLAGVSIALFAGESVMPGDITR